MTNLLKTKRLALGLTQVQLAEKLGLDHASISSWECGRSAPAADLYPVLADLFGMDAEAFVRELESEKAARKARQSAA